MLEVTILFESGRLGSWIVDPYYLDYLTGQIKKDQFAGFTDRSGKFVSFNLDKVEYITIENIKNV
jgi:hypothetical protein